MARRCSPGAPIHSGPGVADCQYDVLTARERGSLAVRPIRDVDVVGGDGEFAAAGHRIARVDREIHHDLLSCPSSATTGQVLGSSAHASCTSSPITRRSSPLASRTASFDVQHAGLQHLLPAEGEQLARQTRGAIGGAFVSA